ncbi:HAMP domain-containing sensor histidine kinase [Actinoplanes sp. NEAU-A12]|uniref:Sensor-like histidine kinase SenX3 n=1 Tax=Actinoplanes sandaracinus TaxID=3045177 RepID=A0ABT6WYE4_9ACTN|nr:HAMP domain-containing sensor histidine kinase [Actinoplanes sandaracinus]MDI6104761.1 HAMP domain-containing sensor histidine kinase [Actinoplanes sandaracinus]
MIRSLRRLRRLLTAWFTAVMLTALAVLLVVVAGGAAPEYGPGSGLTGFVAVLGGLVVAMLGVAAWSLLGHLLAPVTRSLQAQESFLGAAAHDLRTPLATLAVLLDTVRHGGAEREEALDRAVRLAARSGGIVDDLLLRARLAAGTRALEPQAARLDQLVEGVLADLADTDPTVTEDPDGSTTVTVDVGRHRVTLIAAPTIAHLDAPLAERAVTNLVRNALRHGHLPDVPAAVQVTVASADDVATVTVADDGPGLRPPELRAGLGLSLVRWVARVHGGALLLGTGPAPGTRIRLAFPLGGARPAHRL